MGSHDTALHGFYDEYERIEAAFQSELDQSLRPRSSDLLYEIADGLHSRAGATILDLGCGSGQHTLRLATRYEDASVIGVDPTPRHIGLCVAALSDAARSNPRMPDRVTFEAGCAESIPMPDGSVDIIWCREMLYHVNLPAALAECRRILRPDGRVLIYYHVATNRLAPQEAAWFLSEGLTEVVAPNMDERYVEPSFARAGFRMLERIDAGSEFGERAEEDRGESSRRLLHAARLLRDPRRYKTRFGEAAYNVMLGDCFWHIYRMMGKLSSRIYVLAPG